MTRRSLLSALLISTLAPLPALAAGGVPVQLTFRPSADIGGSVIRLSDIAEIQCADTKLAEALRLLDIGSSPLFGTKRTVSVAYARLRVKSLGVRDEQLQYTGPESVAITRVFQSVSGQALLQAAREAIEPQLTDGVLQPSTPPQEIRVAPGELTLRAREPHLTSTSASVVIEICVNQQVESTITLNLRVVQRTRALVASHPLTAGTILTEDDLAFTEIPANPGTTFLLDAALALGRQLSVSLQEGAPVLSTQLRLIPLVRRGARVKVTCRSGSVALACTGEAQQDGTMGQTIRIRNVISQLDFSARVIGQDELEMVF